MVQWVWPVPLFLIACFAPESLWYLVKVGREDDARATTKRLAPSEYLTDQLVDRQIALMKHTIEMEKAETQGASFLDCFKGSNLRRIEIVMMAMDYPVLVRPKHHQLRHAVLADRRND